MGPSLTMRREFDNVWLFEELNEMNLVAAGADMVLVIRGRWQLAGIYRLIYGFTKKTSQSENQQA